jgi:hypothetical protein
MLPSTDERDNDDTYYQKNNRDETPPEQEDEIRLLDQPSLNRVQRDRWD